MITWAAMSVDRIEVPLPRDGIRLSQVRSEVEAALADLPVGLVNYRWEGDVLRFTAPGTDGRVYVRDGHLCARAELGFPAILFRAAILRQAREGLERFAESVKTAGDG